MTHLMKTQKVPVMRVEVNLSLRVEAVGRVMKAVLGVRTAVIQRRTGGEGVEIDTREEEEEEERRRRYVLKRRSLTNQINLTNLIKTANQRISPPLLRDKNLLQSRNQTKRIQLMIRKRLQNFVINSKTI